MRGRMFGAGIIVAVSGFVGAFSYDQLVKPAVADAGPLSGLATREQNVDSNGFIRVHEQSTANVNVTNASLPVTGNVGVSGTVGAQQSGPWAVAISNLASNPVPVAVGNQPNFAFDANGNLRVTDVGGGAGRSAAVLLNLTGIGAPPNLSPTPFPFITSNDLSVGQFTELDLDAKVVSGPSCTIDVALQRKAAFGDYFTIDTVEFTNPNGGSASESIGAGASKNVTFGSTIRIVASASLCFGGPALSISVIGK